MVERTAHNGLVVGSNPAGPTIFIVYRGFMEQQSAIIVRPAAQSDAGLILTFIKELAAYEKLAHEVIATEEDLREELFGDRPSAEVLLAYDSGVPQGIALFFHNFSTFVGRRGIYLEDLYVRPEARGRGIGKKLLVELAKTAKARDCGRLEWAVLDWNEPAIRFYQSIGAEAMDGWTVNRLNREGISRLAAEK